MAPWMCETDTRLVLAIDVGVGVSRVNSECCRMTHLGPRYMVILTWITNDQYKNKVSTCPLFQITNTAEFCYILKRDSEHS